MEKKEIPRERDYLEIYLKSETIFDKFWEEFEPIIQDKNEAIKTYRKGFRNYRPIEINPFS